jgi:hypothetical protein
MADAPEQSRLEVVVDCLCSAVTRFCSLTVACSMFVGVIVYMVGVMKLLGSWGSMERIVLAHFIAMMFAIVALVGYVWLFLKGQRQVQFMTVLTGILIIAFTLVGHSIGIAVPTVADCGGNFSVINVAQTVGEVAGGVAGGIANGISNISHNRTINGFTHPRGSYSQSLVGCHDQSIVLGGALVTAIFELVAIFDVQRVLLRRVRAKTYGERFTEMGIK